MSLPVLPRYQRSDYGSRAPRVANVRRTSPATRGWGSGWPNCQPGRLVYVTTKRPRDGADFTVRVDKVLAPLVGFLMAASFELGKLKNWELRKAEELSVNNVKQGGVGSYSCRAIKGSNPPVPSWHSFRIAVDLNSRSNPMRRTEGFSSTQLPVVVELWESAGFEWGGRWSASDAMHFEYLFQPSDVQADMANAKAAFERLMPKEDEVTKEQVQLLQNTLNALGASPKLEVDGIYGPKTEAALRQAVANMATLNALLKQREAAINAAVTTLTGR